MVCICLDSLINCRLVFNFNRNVHVIHSLCVHDKSHAFNVSKHDGSMTGPSQAIELNFVCESVRCAALIEEMHSINFIYLTIQ